MKHDIQTIEDIRLLVDRFYEAVQNDTVIGPIFNNRLEGRWDSHHEKLYRFWHTVLLRRPDYFGDPVPLHFNLQLTRSHFDYWLTLWNSIVDTYFEGPIADRAKFRGKTMAMAFWSKIKKANESAV